MIDIRNVLKTQGLLAGNELLANLITARRRDAAKTMTAKPWWRIENASGDEAKMWIFDEISWFGVTAASLLDELRAITAPKVIVHINSPGGDVFDGIAIGSLLRGHPAYVTTRDESLAASIASVIMQAGDRRIMVQHSTMMIHEASGAFWGQADEMRAFADLLDKVSDNIAGIYAERSGDGKGDRDAFRAAMRAETWLSDVEAVELGLADEVEVPTPVPAPTATFATGGVVGTGGTITILPFVSTTVDPAVIAAPVVEAAKPKPTDADRDRIRAQWLEVIPNATKAHEESMA